MIALVGRNSVGFPFFGSASSGDIADFLNFGKIHSFGTMLCLSPFEVVGDTNIHHVVAIAKFVLIRISTHKPGWFTPVL